MPKATLTFNLPEDKSEHQDALKGVAYRAALEEIYNEVFRKRRKYMELPKNQIDFLRELETEFHSILNGYDIKLFE